MALDEKLLEILCCPATKVPVKLLTVEQLDKLNEKINEGNAKEKGGDKVEKPLEEALITEDGKTVYAVDSGIPIMLADKGISTDQLGGL